MKENNESHQLPLNIERVSLKNINVYLFPYDHFEDKPSLQQALLTFDNIKKQFTDIVPIFEYFPPEVQMETGENTKSQNPVRNEYANIVNTYGRFIDEACIDKVLVADPAYNALFVIPDSLPLMAGGIMSIGGIKEIIKLGKSSQDSQRELTRRNLLRLSISAGLAAVGVGTTLNQILQYETGDTKNFDTSDLPLALASGREFRMLTVAYALRQLDESSSTDSKNFLLVYPPSHLKIINNILQGDSISQGESRVKFDAYRLAYSLLGILNIREWKRSGGKWERTKKTPINF